MSVKYEAMYTKRLTQRSKNFQDGFVEIEEQGNSRFSVKLTDDCGSLLAKMCMPELPPLDGTDFRFAEFLVEIFGDERAIIGAPNILPEAPKLGFRAPKTIEIPKRTPKMEIQKLKMEVKPQVPKIRQVPRTLDEIVTLVETAGSEKKHDRGKIQSNLMDFLE